MTRWHSAPAELYAVVEHTPATVLLESSPPPPADSGSNPPNSPIHCAPPRAHRQPSAENSVSFCGNRARRLLRPLRRGLLQLRVRRILRADSRADQPSRRIPATTPGLVRHLPFPPHLRPCNRRFPRRTTFHPWRHTPHPPAPTQFSTAPSTLPNSNTPSASRKSTPSSAPAMSISSTSPFPFRSTPPGSSAALYRRLRSLQPAPYGAFLHTHPNHRILSFSPELFFRIESKIDCRHSERERSGVEEPASCSSVAWVGDQ
jgi:hypothetical protein